MACGDNYTVAGTMNNALYMWGRGCRPTSQPTEELIKDSKNRDKDKTSDLSLLQPSTSTSHEEVASVPLTTKRK